MDLNYTVKEGDTVTKIAADNNTTAEEVVRKNNLRDSNYVQVGQVLKFVAEEDSYEAQANATAAKIAAAKREADKIAADKIAADKIAADKIAADKIAAERNKAQAEKNNAKSLLSRAVQGPSQEGQFIQDEEGGSVDKSYRLKYTMKDESGKEVVEEFLTGGVGHRMTEKEARGYPEGTKIPKKVRDEWFKVDLAEAEADADALIPKDAPTEVREIITNMAFNLGRTKLGGFKDMLKAIKNKDYETASLEMMDSKWSAQVGDRAVNLAERMRNVQK